MRIPLFIGLLALSGCRLFDTHLEEEALADTAAATCDHMQSEIEAACGRVSWAISCGKECRRVLQADSDAEQAWHDCWHAADATCEGLSDCMISSGFRCGPDF